MSLDEERRQAVVAAVRDAGARRVLDLGCGEGKLVRALVEAGAEVVGIDASVRSLQYAQRRIDRLPERARARAKLLQGALGYRDVRLEGFDAAAVVEVIEHLTTPNAEYNVLFPTLQGFRHPDHRFEWTRADLASWVSEVGREHGYSAEIRGVGASDERFGCPTQLVVFTRCD